MLPVRDLQQGNWVVVGMDILGKEKCAHIPAVETQTESTNQIAVASRVAFCLSQEFRGAGFGQSTEVVHEFLGRHANTSI